MQEEEINIEKLDFPEFIRRRPGMYIGTTENPDVILREVIDNSVDELLASKSADTVLIDKIGEYHLVADNGRGLPIIMDSKHGITKAELAMANTHAGSKFTKKNAQAGMNGVGASCTNALSDEFIILSKVTLENWNQSVDAVKERVQNDVDKLDGTQLFYVLTFNKGIKVSEECLSLKEVESKLGVEIPVIENVKWSTITLFKPDLTIFETSKTRVPESNFQNSLVIFDKFHKREVSIYVYGKKVEMTKELYKYELITSLKLNSEENPQVDIFISFEFDEDMSLTETSGSVNSLNTPRGFHIHKTKDLICQTLSEQFAITHRHVSNGLKFFSLILAPEVSFDSQTKENLSSVSGMTGGDYMSLRNKIVDIFKSDWENIKVHVERLNEYAKSMEDIKAISYIDSMVGMADPNSSKARSHIPAKVFDASGLDRSKCELFIVEGRSASTQLVEARDSQVHAILPLTGKPMNTIMVDYEGLLENQEMLDLVMTIGLGINQRYQVDNIRYGKVIIAADADPDGAAISALILGAIATHMTFLIDNEMVYIAEPPLYYQEGVGYIYPSDDVDSLLNRDKEFTRFKGLGEMNPNQVKDTLIDPDKRRLRLVTSTEESFTNAKRVLTSRHKKKEMMIEGGVLIDPHNLGFF